jgi:hypothetical protein
MNYLVREYRKSKKNLAWSKKNGKSLITRCLALLIAQIMPIKQNIQFFKVLKSGDLLH